MPSARRSRQRFFAYVTQAVTSQVGGFTTRPFKSPPFVSDDALGVLRCPYLHANPCASTASESQAQGRTVGSAIVGERPRTSKLSGETDSRATD